LRRAGIDVRTTYEENMLRSDDDVQLMHARKLNRVIYTSNVGDFCRLHSQFLKTGNSHAGIVIIMQGAFSVGDGVRRLLSMQRALEIE
jgi:hypothetical protein